MVESQSVAGNGSKAGRAENRGIDISVTAQTKVIVKQ